MKKTATINAEDLAANSGEGTHLSSFHLFPDGNICMLFEKQLREGTRVIIKIHNRLGIRRQCSFTALDSHVLSAFLDRNELYAILTEEGNKLTVNRLEPDTKEDLFPIEPGEPVQILPLSKDDISIVYKDKLISYIKGKPEISAPCIISLDNNRNRISIEGLSKAGFTYTRDGSLITFNEGMLTATDKDGNRTPVLEEAFDDCKILRDNVALKRGEEIYLYKVY